MVLERFLTKLALRRRRPGYRSRFGGLWTDRPDAPSQVEAKLREGRLGVEQAEQLRAWIEDGYVVIRNAIPAGLADTIRGEIDAAWQRHDQRIKLQIDGDYFPLDPGLREGKFKLLDFYVYSEAALRAVFAPGIRAFLELVFERDLLVFQSLSFEHGTEQDLHQDPVYVVVSSPMEFAASWIALEDVLPGSGELCYYIGSHRLEECLFAGRYKNWNRDRDGDEVHRRYLEDLRRKAATAGLELKTFTPGKGDALIWSADLAHGGSRVTREDCTRKSLVSHYCPADVRPYYMSYLRKQRTQREFAPGCYYSSSHYRLEGTADPLRGR